MYDVITRRRRARLVIFMLLALALVADPLSHNHLFDTAARSFSASGESGSLQHPSCPVCASGGGIAVLEHAETTVFVPVSRVLYRALPIAELSGETRCPASRAPPASLI